MSFTVVYKGHKQIDGKLVPGTYVRTEIERINVVSDKDNGDYIEVFAEAMRGTIPTYVFQFENFLRVVPNWMNGGMREAFVPDDESMETIHFKLNERRYVRS